MQTEFLKDKHSRDSLQQGKRHHGAKAQGGNVHSRKDIANLEAHLETKDELLLKLEVLSLPYDLESNISILQHKDPSRCSQ